jgi:bifunctional DNA-binding transcriptional regulator/antitoxin component of YhaV-PrlF toxin-antitoxin module
MTDPDAKLEATIDAQAAELARLNEAIIMDVVGIAQAAGDLRDALDALDDKLDARDLRGAADLGYRDIASAFIFLQRTLGALNSTDGDLSAAVSEVAWAAGRSYEDVEPAVLTKLDAMHPKAESDPLMIKMGVKGKLTLPDAVRSHLGADTAATLCFEPLPDGRVVVEMTDPGPVPELRAEMRKRMNRLAAPEGEGET